MEIVCSKCSIEKNESEFYIDKRKKSGRFSICIDCHHLRDQANYQKKHHNSSNCGPGKHERIKQFEKGLFWCSRCKSWKNSSEFHKSKHGRYGYTNWCRQCKHQYSMSPQRRIRRKQYEQIYSRSAHGKYVAYKHSAKTRNIPFDLTPEEFYTFWKQSCYYCGDPIETIGLDRKSNDQGYYMNNCVACCHVCNFDYKRGHSDLEFLAHIHKIAKKHFSRTVV